MEPVRTLIVAGDPLARAALAALLEDMLECSVIGQVAGIPDLPGNVAIYRPDVILWDLGWDPTSVSQALEGVDTEDLDIRRDDGPVILALVPDRIHAPDAWASGIRGLLSRDAGAEILVSALQAVAQGMVVLDPELADSVLPTIDDPTGTLVEELTPREIEVLQLLAEGLSNKAIAHRLDISEHTVKFHVNAILGKLGAQSRTEAVVRATRLGLILL
jgi:DNA-binding NarL/FixJ family response regulator